MHGVKEPSVRRTSPRSPRSRYVYGPECSGIISEIVEGVLHGLDVDRVHPSLYADLYRELCNKRRRLLQDKNSRGASTLKSAIDVLERDYPDRIRESGHDDSETDAHELELREYGEQLAREEEQRKDNAHFTPEELHLAVQLAVDEEFDELDPRVLKKLVPELRRLQKEAIRNGRYLDAGKYNTAAHKIRLLSTHLRYEEMTAEHAEELEQRVLNMSFDLKKLKQKWNRKIEEAQQQLDEDIEELVREQRYMIRQFDEQFNAEIPIQYCKYTSLVSELKKKEEYLVLSKRFEEAHEAHEQVEAQMREEEKTFRDKYYADLILKRDDFINRIEKKIRIRQDAANLLIDKLLVQKKRALDRAKKALTRFEIEAQEAEAIAQGSSLTSPFTRVSTSGTRNNSEKLSNRSLRSGRSNMSARTLRNSLGSPQKRSSEELFKQRRAINSIIYTRTSLPRINRK